MANKKKKITTAIVAGVTAVALLLGGTFAWQSINQTALNEVDNVVNPGGRLHDDFNGSNKDVYVENFADENIFARIRLEEFFEITQAGGTVHSIAGARDENGNVAEYALHDFYSENATEAYWNWQTGGSTVFMPTFNKNKDSLVADVNGTYNGKDGVVTNDADDDRYSDYIEYYFGQKLSGDAIYDYDSNDADELGENLDDYESYPDNVTTVTEEHTAKNTLGATLISMDEWFDDYSAEPGPYWVYDTDGWVYWADAIEPGEATGLLLDGISLKDKMDDSWYYAINVIAQFVTADDVGKSDNTGFYDTTEGLPAPTPEAEALLKAIGVDMGEDEPGSGDEVFTPQAGTLEGINMKLRSDSEYIHVNEATNTLLVRPDVSWTKVYVDLIHPTLELELVDTTQAIFEWDEESGDWVSHDENIVDIKYYDDGLDLNLIEDAAGKYKLTADYSDDDGNTYEGSIEFVIEVYDGPLSDDEDREEPYITYTFVPEGEGNPNIYRKGNVVCLGDFLYIEVFDEEGSPISWDGISITDDDDNSYEYTTEGIETYWDGDEEYQITPQAKIEIPETTATGEICLNIKTPGDDSMVYFVYIQVIQAWEISLIDENGDEHYKGATIPEGEYSPSLNYSEYEDGYPEGKMTLTYYDEEGEQIGETLVYEEAPDVINVIKNHDGAVAEYFVLTHTVAEGSPLNYEGSFYVTEAEEDDEGGDLLFNDILLWNDLDEEENTVKGGEFILFGATVFSDGGDQIAYTDDVTFAVEEVTASGVSTMSVFETTRMDGNALFVAEDITNRGVTEIIVTATYTDQDGKEYKSETPCTLKVKEGESPLSVNLKIDGKEINYYDPINKVYQFFISLQSMKEETYSFNATLNDAPAEGVTWSIEEDDLGYYVGEDGGYVYAYAVEDLRFEWNDEISVKKGDKIARINTSTGEFEILADDCDRSIQFLIQATDEANGYENAVTLYINRVDANFHVYDADKEADTIDSYFATYTSGTESVINLGFSLLLHDKAADIDLKEITGFTLFEVGSDWSREVIDESLYSFEKNDDGSATLTIHSGVTAAKLEFEVFYNHGVKSPRTPDGLSDASLTITDSNAPTDDNEVDRLVIMNNDGEESCTYVTGSYTKIRLYATPYTASGNEVYSGSVTWYLEGNPKDVKLVQDGFSAEVWIFKADAGQITVKAIYSKPNSLSVHKDDSFIITAESNNA